MWSWTCETSKETDAELAQVWQVWKRVEGWPAWDDALEWSRIEGPFEAGSNGIMKPKDWSAFKFKLTEVIDGKASKSVTSMPFGTKLEFRCLVEKLDSGKTMITHHMRARGLLAPLLRFSMLPKLKAKMPQALSRLVKIAKEQS